MTWHERLGVTRGGPRFQVTINDLYLPLDFDAGVVDVTEDEYAGLVAVFQSGYSAKRYADWRNAEEDEAALYKDQAQGGGMPTRKGDGE